MGGSVGWNKTHTPKLTDCYTNGFGNQRAHISKWNAKLKLPKIGFE